VALLPLLPLEFARLVALALFTAAAAFVPFISLRSCDATGVLSDCCSTTGCSVRQLELILSGCAGAWGVHLLAEGGVIKVSVVLSWVGR